MDVTMIGLQNAGKTSLLRVLSVSNPADRWIVIDPTKY
jgi:GTPase involved in cell partitioning and DNA repair